MAAIYATLLETPGGCSSIRAHLNNSGGHKAYLGLADARKETKAGLIAAGERKSVNEDYVGRRYDDPARYIESPFGDREIEIEVCHAGVTGGPYTWSREDILISVSRRDDGSV